jgi:acetyltransferase
MAIIIVPSEGVLGIVKEAAEKGIRGCIVISAGFKEIGGRGAELERELRDFVRSNGIRMIGPNCLGVINTNPSVRMNASFARRSAEPGNIAFISQSGALCASVLDLAAGRHIGFSKFISFGNKADVNEVDFLRYLRDDPDTDVILMYLEDISDGPGFMDAAREITWGAQKPILAVKSGSSPEGARAASSHTGSMAGSDTTYDAIFLQSGIQRVEGINELFHYAQAFALQPLPRGNRVAIVTNAGGPGIMTTDAAIRHGLALASFSEDTKRKLREALPPTATIQNPLDVIGDAPPERYERALRQVLTDDGVDAAIVILTPQAMINILDTAEIVPRVTKDIQKTILCSFMGLVDVSEAVRYLERHGIPNYAFPEAAARTMAAMARFSERLRRKMRQIPRFAADREGAAAIIAEKLAGRDRYYMAEKEASDILRCYGFPLMKSRLAREVSEVEEAVKAVGLPVAMKIDSPDIVHKVDAGGVRLSVKSPEEARMAFEEIVGNAKRFKPDARISGVLVVQMARPGVEVILGASRDPKFGPICMFGLGGIFVEAYRDVTFRLAPMWETSAENMINSIKAYSVLKGARGHGPSDIQAIKDCILRLSQMVADHPEIAELDMNPVIVYPEGEGCIVADSRMLLTKR